jgi:LuxR family maltose regulon positive regulatory protein
MPKAAQHTLLWLPGRECYILHEQGQPERALTHEDDEAWFLWLTAHSSFSFQGKHGQLNLLREARIRGGEGYWYAYRRQGRQMRKKYVGVNASLTIARLETIAQTFDTSASEPMPVVSHQDTFQVASDIVAIATNAQISSPVSISDHAVVVQPQAPLLAPKLRLPRLHASLIPRDRLLARLDATLEQTLTLLAAPAGSGKTTLVRQWVAARDFDPRFPPVAWVSLDPGDNDPVRFWRYIFTACHLFQPDPGRAALPQLATQLQPPFSLPPLEAALATFLNALTQCEGGVLVLEDYHLIGEQQIHETLTFFLDHLPSHLHVIILTRSEPPFPLARLRARNELGELHASDLRFTAEETTAFLKQSLAVAPSELSRDVLQQLDTHLEGWAAGLRLLVLALRGLTDIQQVERILTTFAGTHRPLQEYFVTEVLNTQSEPLQDFLLRTSGLTGLNGSLCAAVTGREDSGQTLESLDRGGLFLEPLARPGDLSYDWFRYHALFAEAMQQEARRRLGPEALQGIFRTASLWFEEHGMVSDAIEAAFQAQDMPRVAALIEQSVGEQVIGIRPPVQFVEVHTVRRWLAQVPDNLLSQHPLLSLAYASTLLSIYVVDQRTPLDYVLVLHLLDMAERCWLRDENTARQAEIFAFRALLVREQGDLTQAVSLARQALTNLPEGARMWRSFSWRIIGMGEHAAGQLNKARQILQESLVISETTGVLAYIRANVLLLCGVYFEQGMLHLTAENACPMLAQAREEEDYDDICHSLLCLMELSYEWNDLASAELQAQEAFTLSQQLSEVEFQAQAAILLARIQYARGETATALQQVDALLSHLPASARPGSPSRFLIMQELLAWQCRLQLASSDFAAAQRWVSARELRTEMPPRLQNEREELLVARWLLVQEKRDDVLALLMPLLASAQETGRVRYALEIQVLIALTYAARKQMSEARALLQEVLTQARPEGYLRLFLDEGEPLAALLRSLIPLLREPVLLRYAQSILRAFPQTQGEQKRGEVVSPPVPLQEPLSIQEQRVLRLLVAGRTNQEIANALTVSVNTVKTHLQRLYRKMGVGSRSEARAAARQLHLF